MKLSNLMIVLISLVISFSNHAVNGSSLLEVELRLNNFLKEHKPIIIGFYTYNRGNGELAVRTLIRYRNIKSNKIVNSFQDQYTKFDMSSIEKKAMLIWGSYYLEDSESESYTLVNDQNNDGVLESEHNTNQNSGLKVSNAALGYPIVRDQVLTCSSDTSIKGTGTKVYSPQSFIYTGEFNSDCPGHPRGFSSTYVKSGE